MNYELRTILMRTLFLFVFFPFLGTSQNNYNYKNLVLEGSGIRGLVYPGALKVLEEKGIIKNIENVAGSSGGAIMSLMISLGYTSHEIDSLVQSLKIQQLHDGNIFGIPKRLKKEYGIFKGNRYEKWIGHLVQNKTGAATTTFLQLHQLRVTNVSFKEFYCTGTNITKQRLQIFSWRHTPQMQLKTSVRISGSLPVYFKPVAVDGMWNKVPVKNNKNKFDLYIDGGLLNNYPINMFDTCLDGNDPFNCENIKYNYQTLGLKLERPEQLEQFKNGITAIAPYPVSSLNDYLLALLNLLQETLARKTINLQNEKGRTIFMSYGNVFGKIRKVSPAEKKELFNNGVKAAENFLNDNKSHHNALLN